MGFMFFIVMLLTGFVILLPDGFLDRVLILTNGATIE